MSGWEDWQIIIVFIAFAAKYFLLGSIWGHMRATHRMNRAIRAALSPNPTGGDGR